jgi:hypothetical protein
MAETLMAILAAAVVFMACSVAALAGIVCLCFARYLFSKVLEHR